MINHTPSTEERAKIREDIKAIMAKGKGDIGGITYTRLTTYVLDQRQASEEAMIAKIRPLLWEEPKPKGVVLWSEYDKNQINARNDLKADLRKALHTDHKTEIVGEIDGKPLYKSHLDQEGEE